METVYIITGHGKYGTSMQSCIEYLLGSCNYFYYLDLLCGEKEEDYLNKLNFIINKNKDKNILIICDIVQGTPFKNASKIALENSNIEVVSGCNVTSIIDTSFIKNILSLDDLSNKIVELSKAYTQKLIKNYQ